MTRKLSVGVLGAGVFGTYHAGKVAGSELAELAGVFDADGARAEALVRANGGRSYDDADALFEACDAVMIATPARTHFELADAALKAGKHVFVEKPLALTAGHAEQLVNQAHKSGLVLQVGHQERLVCKALGLFDADLPIEHIELIRHGPPPKAERAMDVSVIWDLMIHDIDLAHCLLGKTAQIGRASGRCELGTEFDAVEADIDIEGVPVRLSASRIAPSLERRMKLRFEDGEVEVDFIKRTVANTTRFTLNAGFASDLPDPLRVADEGFFAACLGRAETPVSGQTAAFAVATAEKLASHAVMNTGNS